MAELSPPPRDRAVAYLTDVEGLWDKLAAFAEGNPYVTLRGDGRLEVADGAVFVFGGDAIDRGPSSRRIVSALLDLKRRQPERTVLLAGNRDLNKIRLSRELRGEPPARTPPELREGPRADLLRFLLAHTMNARAAFDRRREELVGEGASPSDDDVVESFLADVAPDGVLTEYLAACTLAHREGSTLFVHGAVTEENLGDVPDGCARTGDLATWIERLDAWYRRQIQAYREGRREKDGAPAWAPILAYQAPQPGSRWNQASVVYGRPADAEGNAHLPPDGVIDALGRAGVRRVVVGHTPNGDTPSVLRDRGFELVLADNSYAPLEHGAKVLIERDTLRISGRARLDAGDEVDVALELSPSCNDTPLGRRVARTRQLVKGLVRDDEYLLFRALPSYRIEQVAIGGDRLAGEELVAPLR